MVQLAGASATNQVAIVTGGGKGLGLAIAKRLSGGGCRVVLCASTFTRVDEAQAGFTPAMKHISWTCQLHANAGSGLQPAGHVPFLHRLEREVPPCPNGY